MHGSRIGVCLEGEVGDEGILRSERNVVVDRYRTRTGQNSVTHIRQRGGGKHELKNSTTIRRRRRNTVPGLAGDSKTEGYGAQKSMWNHARASMACASLTPRRFGAEY